jgi:hypothetical protein
LNFTFGFRLVLAPNYLLMTLIRVSITRGVTTFTYRLLLYKESHTCKFL